MQEGSKEKKQGSKRKQEVVLPPQVARFHKRLEKTKQMQQRKI